jgi:hypothetical protein
MILIYHVEWLPSGEQGVRLQVTLNALRKRMDSARTETGFGIGLRASGDRRRKRSGQLL